VPTLADSPAKLAIRTAMEAGDLPAVVDAFAPDAVLRSPLTGRLTFRGQAQIRAVMEVILEVFEDLRYDDELQGGDSAVLVASARVGGRDIEMVDHMRLDENGKIRELTVFFRPLPAIAVAMGLIGRGLGRRKSAARGLAISALTQPLELMTEMGDRVGVRLVGPTL
jgi:ketosteroid isomerase-like protein